MLTSEYIHNHIHNPMQPYATLSTLYPTLSNHISNLIQPYATLSSFIQPYSTLGALILYLLIQGRHIQFLLCCLWDVSNPIGHGWWCLTRAHTPPYNLTILAQWWTANAGLIQVFDIPIFNWQFNTINTIQWWQSIQFWQLARCTNHTTSWVIQLPWIQFWHLAWCTNHQVALKT